MVFRILMASSFVLATASFAADTDIVDGDYLSPRGSCLLRISHNAEEGIHVKSEPIFNFYDRKGCNGERDYKKTETLGHYIVPAEGTLLGRRREMFVTSVSETAVGVQTGQTRLPVTYERQAAVAEITLVEGNYVHHYGSCTYQVKKESDLIKIEIKSIDPKHPKACRYTGVKLEYTAAGDSTYALTAGGDPGEEGHLRVLSDDIIVFGKRSAQLLYHPFDLSKRSYRKSQFSFIYRK